MASGRMNRQQHRSDRPAPLILCGVTGGIAAYKAADVVSGLVRHGYRLRVIMSEAATRFVTPLTFQALSGSPVMTEMFPPPQAGSAAEIFPHIHPASEADLFLLVPATADVIARLAAGRAQDLISAAALALPLSAQRVFCPSMNSAMWMNPIVQRNVNTLESYGWFRIGPDSGRLACGTSGPGRLAEPQRIITQVESLLSLARSLRGKTILVCSGPTREHLDEVRFISNASSGRMGRELALAAAAAGAHVVFVTGPVCPQLLPRHPSIEVIPVTSSQEMLETARRRAPECDAYLFAAAVADFQPAQRRAGKISRDSRLTLELTPTTDISAAIGRTRPPGTIAVGFSLQTRTDLPAAKRKLENKNLDAVVVNDTRAMEAEEAEFHFLHRVGDAIQEEAWGRLPKQACAVRIIRWMAGRLQTASQ